MYFHDAHDLQRDMITWLLEEAEPYQRDPTHIAMRLLRVNFAGLMSTSFVSAISLVSCIILIPFLVPTPGFIQASHISRVHRTAA